MWFANADAFGTEAYRDLFYGGGAYAVRYVQHVVETKPERVILKFDGDYRFLSNFFPVTVYLDGDAYHTVEHAYQAAKTTQCYQRGEIRLVDSPGAAKRMGQKVTLRSEWRDDRFKAHVMLGLLMQKFKDPELQLRLLNTDGKLLVEGNTWGDRFWGVTLPDYNGINILGAYIMFIRHQLQFQRKEPVYHAHWCSSCRSHLSGTPRCTRNCEHCCFGPVVSVHGTVRKELGCSEDRGDSSAGTEGEPQASQLCVEGGLKPVDTNAPSSAGGVSSDIRVPRDKQPRHSRGNVHHPRESAL